MSSIRARHTVSGVIAEVPEHIFKHEDLGRFLEAVPEDAKPYLPEMHVPREADEAKEPDVKLPKIDPKDDKK